MVLLMLYLIYKWVQAPQGCHSFNRWLLLGIYALALAAPLLYPVVSGWFETSTGTGRVAIELPEMMQGGMAEERASQESQWRIATVLLWVYVSGMGVAALMTALNFTRIFRIIHEGSVFETEGQRVILTRRKDVAPFSFGRYIVIPEGEAEEKIRMIILHEQAHISLGHWADLLFAQAVCIFQWYNPAAWLMQEELKSVHEYQADQRVMESGADMREYQLLLIEKAVGARFPSLANSLNHSKLKKRITMMCKNQKTSRSGRLLRPLLLIPALGAALWMIHLPAVASAMSSIAESTLARPVLNQPAIGAGATEKQSDFSSPAPSAETPRKVTNFISEPAQKSPEKTAKESSKPLLAVEEVAEYPGGMKALMEFLKSHIQYPENATASGRVIVRFVVETDGSIGDVEIVRPVSPELDAEAARVVKMMPRWTPGKVDGKPVASYFNLPVNFKPDPAPATTASASVSNSSESKSTSVSRSVSTSTSSNGTSETTVTITSNNDENPMSVSVTSTGKNRDNVIYYVDGERYYGDLSDIPSSKVDSMSVEKHDDTPSVIRITLKK